MSAGHGTSKVAVIGAGSSGLPVVRALRQQGVAVECFERGSDVGGLSRYENDNGLSGAYDSLRTDVSRGRMQYPSFPMPRSFADFPSHGDMAAYLGACANSFGLRNNIRFPTTVERVKPDTSGTWIISLDDGSVRPYRAVAVGLRTLLESEDPDVPGELRRSGSHSHKFRTPEPFEGHRVLVVGAGQSASEIAVEVSGVAARTFMSVRSGTRVLPRWLVRCSNRDLDRSRPRATRRPTSPCLGRVG